MPRRTGATGKTVETLKHDEATRRNIPTAEYQSVLQKEQESPVRVAYQRRNRDLDPQLVWRGKDEQDWSDLVVQAPPLYIQEKVHPKVLIDDLMASSQWLAASGQQATDHRPLATQLDLFADFNGIPQGVDRTEFYQHDQNWSNRMILGDSLQVMASLAEREGLRGKVQCIYLDPPYGIKFNSNFQWSTTSRDVKDGNAAHITREPEQVKAVRVSRDVRLIVHRTEASLLLCYVGHHDHAYAWAERRRLETHPATGAAQLVEVRERVEEITVPRYVEVAQAAPAPAKPPLFAQTSEEDLLRYGVPPEWLAEVRLATEDSLLELADHLPKEAAEALLDVATGVPPRIAEPVAPGQDPFQHPDAQRRFRVVQDIEELERALDYPWDKWTVFLHPAQREAVERDYRGPARVAGSAGTGKTVVALHRAVFLTRANPDARVLLTTFSDTLANALKTQLRRLIGHEPRLGERLEVQALNAVARRLYERNIGRPEIASHDLIRELLQEAAAEQRQGGLETRPYSAHFLVTEWEEIVDAWQLDTWEAYRDVARLGRKTRLPEKQREALWAVFERLRAGLERRGLVTYAGLLSRLATHLATVKQPPFDFVVVDEAQDVSVAQLRFLAALGAGRPNSLFYAGDLGQRIFQQPFSWKALGVDIRGRSRTLRINYRTSHQIRAQADRLLGPQVTDVDGNVEERRGTISVFNGPEPAIMVLDSPAAEIETVGRWLVDRKTEGVKPRETGVFVRSPAELARARAAVEAAGLPFKVLDDKVDTELQTLGRHGLRRRDHPLAGPHRSGGGRLRPRRGLQHRATSAVRGLHPRPRPPAGHEHRPGIGVPRRPAGVTLERPATFVACGGGGQAPTLRLTNPRLRRLPRFDEVLRLPRQTDHREAEGEVAPREKAGLEGEGPREEAGEPAAHHAPRHLRRRPLPEHLLTQPLSQGRREEEAVGVGEALDGQACRFDLPAHLGRPVTVARVDGTVVPAPQKVVGRQA